jgi:glycosyltransferase involved in cell wall biosynthesis
MQSVPLVTVLMPVYDGERFVDEAIASVLSQDFSDFEFVIVDDGSRDRTPSILRRWAARDSRIVIVRSARNEGVPAALNRGLAVARGRYVARQDADDLCERGRYRRQIELLDRERDVQLVAAGYDLINAEGKWIATEMRREPPEVVKYLLTFSNAVGGHGQVMFRRDVVLALGGYHEEFALSEDYDLWTRLARVGRIVMLPIVGMKHRLHEQRASVVRREEQSAHSLRIARRMMTELLGREIPIEEERAVACVWRQELQAGQSSRAHRVLGETYERFRRSGANRMHRWSARFATARRWTHAAAAFARCRQYGEALRYLGFGMRWHPLGVFAVALQLSWRLVHYFRSAAVRDELRCSWAEESRISSTTV